MEWHQVAFQDARKLVMNKQALCLGHRIARFVVICCLLVAASSALYAANQPQRAYLLAPMSTDDARHLLMRTGIGASPAELIALRGLSRQQAIERTIAGISAEPDIPMPEWVDRPLPAFHARPDMDAEARARFNSQRDAELSQLRQWWVLNLLQSESPQSERMVLFWHDLFATNYHSLGKKSLAMARQNKTFRSLGLGSWEILLKAMIRDAALLEFLDAGSNHKASPNENLARELMELFVLGEGNFDESAVREAARSLTGHSNNIRHDLQFQLRTGVQDRDDKQLFGQTGAFDGDNLVELLLEQEAAPKFLATRFWLAFISDTAPASSWVDDQASRFKDASFDIATLYRNVLESEAFWHSDNRGAMIKSPVDIVAGTARSLEFPKAHWQSMPQWQSLIGMDLLAPPNVAGWKEGAAFITPGHLLNRHRVVRQLTRPAKGAVDQGASMAMAGMKREGMKKDGMKRQDMAMTSSSDLQEQPDPTMMQSTGENRQRSSSSMTDVALRLAAEDFEGPARYRISLQQADREIWQSEPRPFMAGRDTLSMGRIQSMSEVVWQTETVAVPTEQLERAAAIRVHFLNDAAGADGDRNLYVDKIQPEETWLSAAFGKQTSFCAPPLRANAGKLYCAGYIEFEHNAENNNSAMPNASAANFRASTLHMQHGNINKNNGNHVLVVVLDHLQTPDKSFQHVSITLQKRPDDAMTMTLRSFSCWPDCIDTWPECAFIDVHFPVSKHIVMPWVESDQPLWSQTFQHQCQFDSLNENERMLVATLWSELPQILERLKQTHRVQRLGDRWMPVIEFFEDHYQQASTQMSNTAYAPFAKTLDISARHAPAEPILQTLAPPLVNVNSAATLMMALSDEGLQIHDLLFPALTDAPVPELPASDAKRSGQYLTQVLEHPLFQLK